jgi:hypothetical protein
MEFSGRLAAFPVSDILQWAANDRRTGALVVRRPRREKRIYFRDGEVVACISDDPAEYYGRHLLLQGHLDEGRLVKALTYCQKQGKRLGHGLRELGLLSPALIQETLRTQIEDTVCDLFLWRDGVFFFQSEVPPVEEILPEPIHTVGLVMEGIRWIDEHQRIRSVFIHDNVVLKRGVRWPGERLSPVQKRIAAGVDGRGTLAHLYREVKGSHFRFLEAAFDLAVREVLDIESVGEATAQTSQEIRLYDLLVEQAAEEQILQASDHLMVPLDLLADFYPIWVNELPEEARQGLSPELQTFYRRIDGRRVLRELFSSDPSVMNRELDLLLRQLRERNVALLPHSLEQLEAEAQRRGEPPRRRWWQRLFALPRADA